MPPAQLPRSNESGNVQTLPVDLNYKSRQSLYSNYVNRVPSVLDNANTSGCVVVVRVKDSPEDKGIVSILNVPEGSGNAYIESVKYSFLGVTMGSMRQTARNAGVVVSGVATALHNNPRSTKKDDKFSSFMSVGARVAFQFPDPKQEADRPGAKRTLGNGYQPFDNDGILIRRSYIGESKAEQVKFVEGQLNGDEKLWEELGKQVGITGYDGSENSKAQIAYLAERAVTFGQSISNIKTTGETTNLRLLITPP